MFTEMQEKIMTAAYDLAIYGSKENRYEGPLDVTEHRKASRIYVNKVDHYCVFTHTVDDRKFIVLSCVAYDQYGEMENEIILGMIPMPLDETWTATSVKRLALWIEFVINLYSTMFYGD